MTGKNDLYENGPIGTIQLKGKEGFRIRHLSDSPYTTFIYNSDATCNRLLFLGMTHGAEQLEGFLYQEIKENQDPYVFL